MSELKRSCFLLYWQVGKRHCSLRGQYNQRNEQLGAERKLLCIRESRAVRCCHGQGWMLNARVGCVARVFIT